MTQTLSVAAIKNGTVIDHIPAGQGLKIIRLLRLSDEKTPVTIGLNLPSQHYAQKDIIKIENRRLTDQEAREITVFAPHATINIISDFQVTKKIKDSPPEKIEAMIDCPNPCCISRHEPINSFFYVSERSSNIYLQCKYCEKEFNRNDMTQGTSDDNH